MPEKYYFALVRVEEEKFDEPSAKVLGKAMQGLKDATAGRGSCSWWETDPRTFNAQVKACSTKPLKSE